MSTSTIYAKNNNTYRIAYVANGLWRTQQHENFKGTKTEDPWGNISPPMDKDAALANLGRFNKEVKST